MVIQRTWKISSDGNHQQQQNSATVAFSDDSNGSNQTNSSTNTNSSKTQQNNKSVITQKMADNFLTRLKQRFDGSSTKTVTSGQKTSSEVNVMQPLELLRINVQNAFDMEIDLIVKKFMEVYFKPAFKNIKENLSELTVSDDVLQKMSCALLENSKSQYNIRTRLQQQTSTSQMTFQHIPTAVVDNNQQSNVLPHQQQTITTLQFLKRPASEAPSAILLPPMKKPPPPPVGTIVQIQQQEPKIIAQQQPRRQIFWNTSRIDTDTQFVLDVQANQCFGLGCDGKQRLASKHPELIRYLPDDIDRDYLVQQRIIPAQNRNSRFLFLVYEEVLKLGQTEDYRNKAGINLGILVAFRIPQFIIQKMKTFFVDLNIKSRGLITNSYSQAVGGNHLRNALLQGSGSQQHQQFITSSSSVLVGSIVTSTTTSGEMNNPSGIVKMVKSSSLSSSHATLTALLNSNNSNPISVANTNSSGDNEQNLIINLENSNSSCGTAGLPG